MNDNTALALVLSVTLALAACGQSGSAVLHDAGTADVAVDAGDTSEVAPVPCPYLDDGVCDEPANCPLGTDRSDCDSACAEAEPAPELWGACRYRSDGIWNEAEFTPAEGARPSRGSGGRRGRWYGTMKVKGARGPMRPEERHYEVYVPYAYREALAVPLVFYTGGFGDEMYPNSAYTELEALAEQNGFILVNAQQAYRDFGPRGYRNSWYTYEDAWLGDWDALPDLDLFRGIVEGLSEQYNLDLNRVVMTGTSRGGAISIMAALLAPDVFSAFVSQAGFLDVNEFDDFILDTYEGPRVPAFIIVGHQDTNVGPEESDVMEATLRARGWTDDDVIHIEVDPAGHQWQTHLSQTWYDFVMARPMGTREDAQ